MDRIIHKTICSDHFDPACYTNTNRLTKNAAPTIFTPEEKICTTNTVEPVMSPETFLRPLVLFPTTPEVLHMLPACSKSCSNLSTPSSSRSNYSTPLSSG